MQTNWIYRSHESIHGKFDWISCCNFKQCRSQCNAMQRKVSNKRNGSRDASFFPLPRYKCHWMCCCIASANQTTKIDVRLQLIERKKEQILSIKQRFRRETVSFCILQLLHKCINVTQLHLQCEIGSFFLLHSEQSHSLRSNRVKSKTAHKSINFSLRKKCYRNDTIVRVFWISWVGTNID